MILMAQEVVVELAETSIILNDALTLCGECSKIVPKTMTCIYCGTPILFQKPA